MKIVRIEPIQDIEEYLRSEGVDKFIRRFLRILFSETEQDVLKVLISNYPKEFTAEEISNLCSRAVTSVNLALKKLVKLGFVKRKLVLRRLGGGYKYVYSIDDPKHVIEKIIQYIDQAVNIVKQNLEMYMRGR